MSDTATAGLTPPAANTTFDTRLAYIQARVPPPLSPHAYPPTSPQPHAYPRYSSEPPSRTTTPVQAVPYPYPTERHAYPYPTSPTTPFRPAGHHPAAQHPAAHGHSRHPSASSAPLLHAHAPARHPGCVLCGLVTASGSAPPSPVSPASTAAPPVSPASTAAAPPATPVDANPHGVAPYHHPFERSESPAPRARAGAHRVAGRDVVYHDREITVLRAEGKERLCADGRHLIVVLNEHMESVYDLSPSDIPTLSHILDTATQILRSAASASATPDDRTRDLERGKRDKDEKVHVGFVGSIMRDPAFPHKHLHAHAYLGPIDTKLPGAGIWRRNVVFGHMNWWSLEDLRAEIREESSNCRTKTGYDDRHAPIDRVPNAGMGGSNDINPHAYTDHPSAPAAPSAPSARARVPAASRASPLAKQVLVSSTALASASSASVSTIVAEPRGGRGSRDGEPGPELGGETGGGRGARGEGGRGAEGEGAGRTSRGSAGRESEDFEAVELDGVDGVGGVEARGRVREAREGVV